MRIPSDAPPRMERNVLKRLEEGNAGRNNVGEDDERRDQQQRDNQKVQSTNRRPWQQPRTNSHETPTPISPIQKGVNFCAKPSRNLTGASLCEFGELRTLTRGPILYTPAQIHTHRSLPLLLITILSIVVVVVFAKSGTSPPTQPQHHHNARRFFHTTTPTKTIQPVHGEWRDNPRHCRQRFHRHRGGHETERGIQYTDPLRTKGVPIVSNSFLSILVVVPVHDRPK